MEEAVTKFQATTGCADAGATSDRNNRALAPCRGWPVQQGLLKRGDGEIDAQMLSTYMGHSLNGGQSFHSLKCTRAAVNKDMLSRFGRAPMPVGVYTPWLIARCIAGAEKEQARNNPTPGRYALTRADLRLIIREALDHDDAEFAALASWMWYFVNRGGETGGLIHGERSATETGHALRMEDVSCRPGPQGYVRMHLQSSKTACAHGRPRAGESWRPPGATRGMAILRGEERARDRTHRSMWRRCRGSRHAQWTYSYGTRRG